MIHLDTSFLIRALVPDSAEDGLLRQWLGARTPLAISAIAWTEFLCGPLRAPEIQFAERIVGEVLPFGAAEGTVAADLFNRTGRRRGSLVDCMVAAAAMSWDAELATSNPADFRRLQPRGLKVVTV
ncbi:MAG TPA: PIN domain-containing protein [Gemmatimonadales bacterium]